MCIITYSPPKKLNHYVNIAHFTIAAFAPSGNLLRALLLTLNEFSLLCRGRSVVSTPLALDVFGGPILYLILQIFSYLSFLIWWDLDWKPSFARRKRNIDADTEMSDSQLVEGQVREESLRLAKADDPLRVLHVSKRFRNTPAVEDVSFGVRRGEIFALLGPNGAGKSTTISLIRGELRPQRGRGDVLVEGSSIINSRAVARVHLGVCPQFDAMDRMTVLEHLRFYARARGSTDVANDSHAVMRAVGLLDFRDRMAAKLSGGNKRKLSLGIALMGNPSVLLLDEPSSGMDAASKRMMWRTLGAVTAGRSMLLTTHSMEEADALAGRIGIMSQKMLALGATSELRRRHGNTLNVHLVHKDAPMTRQHDMDRINSWILAKFPHAQLERRTFHGQIRFSVPNTPHQVGSEVKEKETERDKDTEKEKEKEKEPEMTVQPLAEPSRSGISVLFQVLEAEKRDLGIEFYSVSQSTLDQVFLKIVGEHNVEEDGLGQGRGRIWQRLTRKLRSVRQGR